MDELIYCLLLLSVFMDTETTKICTRTSVINSTQQASNKVLIEQKTGNLVRYRTS
jgi:hypothetical protein